MASRNRRIASAVVLADDDQDDYRRGPGRRCTPGPVLAAYVVSGALHRPCVSCGAQPEHFCRWPGGHPRKMPCPKRLRNEDQ